MPSVAGMGLEFSCGEDPKLVPAVATGAERRSTWRLAENDRVGVTLDLVRSLEDVLGADRIHLR